MTKSLLKILLPLLIGVGLPTAGISAEPVDSQKSSIENTAELPEPAAVMLLGLGLFGIAAIARRKKQ